MDQDLLRIAIAGTDNSHAGAFASILNRQRLGDERFSALKARVVAICADDDETRGRALAEEHGIDTVVTCTEDLIGRIDAAIVVHRHGGLHAGAAIPLLQAGIPVFVDKPMATSVADVERMIATAQSSNTCVWSCSAVRYAEDFQRFIAELPRRCGIPRWALVSTPADRDSPYGGIWFYAIHGVEMIVEAFGAEVPAVEVHERPDIIYARLSYANGLEVTLQLVRGAAHRFYLLVHGEQDVGYLCVQPARSFYYDTLDRFVNVVLGRHNPLPNETLLTPARILERIAAGLG